MPLPPGSMKTATVLLFWQKDSPLMMTPTRVLSSHLQNTPAASFPKFAPAGSATLACYFSPMLDGLIPTLPGYSAIKSFQAILQFICGLQIIHQWRAVFLVAPLSRGSLVTCFPVSWRWVEIHSYRTSTSHICPLVEPLFAFAFWGLKSASFLGVVEASTSTNTSVNFLAAEPPL